MTKIISRVFPSAAQAQKAADRLALKFLPKRNIRVIEGGNNAETMLTRAEVHPSAVATYAKHLAAGKAVLVVRAAAKPLGAARITRDVLAKFETVDTDKVVNEYKAAWKPDRSPSILKDHPLFLTNSNVETPGLVSDGMSMPLLKERKAKRSLMSGDKRMSRMFWPMPLLKSGRNASSAISGGRYMSRMFWPMSLLSSKPRRKSIIPGGDLPFSRRLGLKTTI
ncbi:MAG: hypothetical protein AB8B82_07380 [Roseovarius sp.]